MKVIAESNKNMTKMAFEWTTGRNDVYEHPPDEKRRQLDELGNSIGIRFNRNCKKDTAIINATRTVKVIAVFRLAMRKCIQLVDGEGSAS